jgi:autotransporter-associated beta strand protein
MTNFYYQTGFGAIKKRKSAIVRLSLQFGILSILLAWSLGGSAQNVSATWGNNAVGTWLTGANWTGGSYAGVTGAAASNSNIATFTSVATSTVFGINMNPSGGLNLGAISIDNTRTIATQIGNSSTTVAGTLRLYGATVNGVNNTILRNNGSGTLTIRPDQTVQPMTLTLSNATENIVNLDGSGNIVISSQILGGSRRLTISGTGIAGNVSITNTNNPFSNSTNQINITGSEARFAADLSMGAAPGLVVPNSIIINGGRWASVGSSTYTINVNRGIQVGATAGTAISVTTSGTITYDGIIANLPANTGVLVKQGAGILLLGGVSTYTGATTINQGELQLGLGDNRLPTGTILNLGQASSTNLGTFNLNGRSQTIGGLNSILGTNNTTANNVITSTPAATLTVNGAGSYGTGSNQNSGIITGAISLVKSGTGTLVLGDANTYTGTTTISGGTLQLANNNVLPDATAVTLSGGTLSSGATTGFTETMGTLNLAASSTIALGTGNHTLTFANSSAVGWTAGHTLTITGWTGTAGASGTAGKIFVGNNATGLTAAQLAQISFSGYMGCTILATGEIVPTAAAPTAPTVSLTAPSAITNDAASSGGNVTADGGNAVTARGTVWSTSTSPTLPGTSSSDGTGLGVFISSVTGLTPETLYYIRAYATNVNGTGYSATPGTTFRTLSNPPSTQAGNFLASAFSASQINLSWDPAVFPLTGATVKGYVIIRRQGEVPTFGASNGQAPAAGLGTLLSPAVLDPSASFNDNAGLSASTSYTYLLIPYTWDGTNATTYNYLTAGAQIVTETTLAASCTPPAGQVASVTMSGATSNSINISWPAVVGTNTLVIVHQGSAVTQAPVSGTGYIASATFGSGTNLGSFDYVCYNGTGTSFTLSGLNPSTTYHVAVYSFNNPGNCYNLVNPVLQNGTTLAAASLIETFEPAVKPAYAAGGATGVLGAWEFDEALVGTTAGSDVFNGTRSARIRGVGTITSLFNKTNGLGTITIRHAKFVGDANCTWRLYVSDDAGASFTAYTSSIVTTTSSTFTATSFNVNIAGNNIRVRIAKLSGDNNVRLNIDDIELGDFVSSNTITTAAISGSPFCVTDLAGSSAFNVNFTSTGVYNSGNVYTAQLSDASGSFNSPVEIGAIASTLNSGAISATIPAGTISGTAYRIRVVSSDIAIIGTQSATAITVYLNTPDVTNFNGVSVSAGTQINLGWINPLACYQDILIVGRLGSPVSSTPSGDGTAYTANLNFGSGTAIAAGEFVVYKNTGTIANITGVTAGNTYFFKIYTRNGTSWSPGVQISVTAFSVAVGDYQSFQNGTWGAGSNWRTWDGSGYNNTPSGPPSGNVNVIVKDVMTLNSSFPSNIINNLTVNTTGKIFANDSVNRYLTVHGNLICNGVIGNGATYDGISFNFNGINQTISGSAAADFKASRIRKNTNTNATTNLLIAKSLTLQFNSNSGTQLLNQVSSGASNFNVTINANTIVELTTATSGLEGNVSIDGTKGENLPECGGTFTVNGTLKIPGSLYAYTNNVSNPVKYVIGNTGIIECVNVVTANSTSLTVAVQTGSNTAGCTLQILNGGKLKLTGSVPSSPLYNLPFSIYNSSFDTYISGLGTNNQTYDFQPGSIVEYASTSGTFPIQSTGLVYSNLLISGGANATINSTLTVNKDLTIVSPGLLNSQNNTINVGGDWNNYATAGFTEGTGTVFFNGFSGAQKIICGNAAGDNFYNVNITNSGAGVELITDVAVANDLNLGTNGKLLFGLTPSILRLTKMSVGSNSLLGSGTALLDMSQSASSLFVGSETINYSGVFNAGTSSLVNYNRDASNVNSGGFGNQTVNTGFTYANLSFSASGAKNTDDNFTVTGELVIDGGTTTLEALTVGRTLTLGNNLTLSGGGAMGTSCLSNLSILTSGNTIQTFNGGFNNINCFNLSSDKTANGIVLNASNSTLTIANNFTLTNSASITPNDNRIQIGNFWTIPAPANFITGTSTIEYNGSVAQTVVPVNYYNLESSSTGNRTMSSTGTIGIANLFTKGTNTFTFTNSTIDYNGSSSQDITPFTANTSIVGRTYENLTLSNGSTVKSLTGATDVEGALTLNNSITLRLADHFLNLKSTATKTARVAPVSASANVDYSGGTGRFVVERFFPGKRAWRLMTAPVAVDATKSFYNSYQAGQNNLSTNAGNGTYISGNPAAFGADGLDITPLNNSSLKTYNPATSSFVNVVNTKTTLLSGTTFNSGVPDNYGFFMFVRGDRFNNPNQFSPGTTVNVTTLRDTGRLQIKNYTFNGNTVGGLYQLIGNPYASPVNFASVNRTNIADRFWSWDPALSTVGGYVLFDGGSGYAPVVVPGYTGTPAQTQHLQSKQAVLVQTIADGTATIGFTESAKSSNNNLAAFRPGAGNIRKAPAITINLGIEQATGAINWIDGVLMQYAPEFKNEFDRSDAEKFININENLGIRSNGKLLMLERRSSIQSSDTIQLSMSRMQAGNYQLELTLSDLLLPGVEAFLDDRFTNQQTRLLLRSANYYPFTTSSTAQSMAENRFRIVFKSIFKHCNLTASVIGSNVDLQWKLGNDDNVDSFVIERSSNIDGGFEAIGAKAFTASAGYSFVDEKVAPGSYYYRLRVVGISGAEAFSNIEKVTVMNNRLDFYVFPNPVTNGQMGLQIHNNAAGQYQLRMLNSTGQLLFYQQLQYNGGSQTHQVKLNNAVPGNYILEVVKPNKQKLQIPVLIQ